MKTEWSARRPLTLGILALVVLVGGFGVGFDQWVFQSVVLVRVAVKQMLGTIDLNANIKQAVELCQGVG